MMKRLIVALCLIAASASAALAAGTIPGISMSQQLDSQGRPLNGGRLYLIQAGTTSTPQNCYQDSALTPGLEWPNPITLDSAGRVPQLFCADGSIKIRLTNAAGVQQLVADNLLVVGPSGGGGGGGSIDPTTILATGDFKMVYGAGPLTGFVRCNGRTIGSATSGATERANADAQSLFEYLWGADTSLSVSGGRGASANADWLANKAITLPDCRGRVLASEDALGSTPAGRLTASFFGLNATTVGSVGGAESQTLTIAQIPSHNHTLTDPGHTHGISPSTFRALAAANAGSFSFPAGSTATADLSISANTTGISIAAAGGGAAHPIVQPTILVTTYIKL